MKRVSIGGPKGVGKSMALAAIATICHGIRPCILLSPSRGIKRSTDLIKKEFSKFGVFISAFSNVYSFFMDTGWPHPQALPSEGEKKKGLVSIVCACTGGGGGQ